MYGVDFAAVGELRPQDARNNHISTKSRHEVFLVAIATVQRDGTRKTEVHAVHVWAENPGLIKNDYFFDKHATEWVINKMKLHYPTRQFKSLTKCVDGSAAQYKSQYALCGLEILRQDVGFELVEQWFGAAGDFKGQHDSEGGDAQRFLDQMERIMKIRCNTVWKAFEFISQPSIFQPRVVEVDKRSKHGVSFRWHAFLCDTTEATEEQRDRHAAQGDVIIVDKSTRWDGCDCSGITSEYQMRAERTPASELASPGLISTRELFCCCPECLVSNYTSCAFPSETSPFIRRQWSRRIRPEQPAKKVRRASGAAGGEGGGDAPPVAAGGGVVGGLVDGGVADLEHAVEPLPVVHWVRCDRKKCKKWRRLADGAGADDWKGKKFTCDMNEWDEAFNSCSSPLEVYDINFNNEEDENS